MPRHHPSCNDIAKAAHRFKLFNLCAGIFCAVFAMRMLAPQSFRAVLGVATDFTPAEVIAFTNLAREQHHLPTLHPVPALMKAAEAKAQAMIRANSWSHNTPDQTPWEFLDAQAYIYTSAGENLAKDFTSAQDVVEAWLNSSSHRDNLLNPRYTDVGVTVTTGEFQGNPQTTLVVLYLGKPYNPEEPETGTDFTTTPLLSSTVAAPALVFQAAGIICIGIALGLLVKMQRRSSKNHPPAFKHWHK